MTDKLDRHDLNITQRALNKFVTKANVPKSPVLLEKSSKDAAADFATEKIIQQNIAQVAALREALGDKVKRFSDTQLVLAWNEFANAKRSDVFVPFIAAKYPAQS